MRTVARTMAAGAVCALMLGGVCRATPTIPADSVTMTQNSTRKVTVTYVLGDAENQEPAVVTVDFETNVTGTVEGPWASIGTRNFREPPLARRGVLRQGRLLAGVQEGDRRLGFRQAGLVKRHMEKSR